MLHYYNCKINNSMKNVSLLLLTMLLTFGCNQKTKEQVGATQESKPQLTAAEIRNLAIQDSLEQVKVDSLTNSVGGREIRNEHERSISYRSV